VGRGGRKGGAQGAEGAREGGSGRRKGGRAPKYYSATYRALHSVVTGMIELDAAVVPCRFLGGFGTQGCYFFGGFAGVLVWDQRWP